MQPEEPAAGQTGVHADPELEHYRTLVAVPDHFEEGFNLKTVIGALFVGLIMTPASIYGALLVGATVGGAAEWVTVILFTEVARRSFMRLTKQEVYILLYVAGALGVSMGGPFAGLIWNQYLVQSPAAKGFQIADQMPRWVVPAVTSPAITQRTFLHPDWLVPIGLMIFGMIIGRLQWLGIGYGLFRVTSDIERLPFPMAPISAIGATALAEHTQKQESWRWHVFSIGAVVGLAWSFFYVFVPSLSGAVLSRPIQLIPIPFIELTNRTEKILPGVATGISTSAGEILTGFVIPFWGVVGTASASLFAFIINPWLVRNGHMPHWEPGMDTIQTSFVAWQDFWLAAGIGVALAIALIGFYEVGRTLAMAKRSGGLTRRARDEAVPVGRGDFPLSLAVAMYVVAAVALVILCRMLIPGFPRWWLVFFGFLYTPIISYISARLIGLIGQGIDIPMIREISFILSGYKGVEIWFAPIPLSNFGGMAQSFRIVELTGTKFTSVIKAEIMLFPLVLVFSLVFWQFIWKLAPVPSNAYPFAQKMWPLQAMQQCLWYTATAENNKFFTEAANKPWVIGGGAAFGLVTYAVLASLRLPTMFVYGLIRGAGVMPHGIILNLAGALLGRFHFEKRYGRHQWRLYAPVLAAGFACGMGLMVMAGSALAMVVKSTRQMPY